MDGVGIRILQIPLKWLELAFKHFESRSNVWNWHSNASNSECIESRSNSWKWHSNPSNLVRMVGIGIRMFRIPLEWLELAFESFESCSNGWNWYLNASNHVRMVGIAIRML